MFRFRKYVILSLLSLLIGNLNAISIVAVEKCTASNWQGNSTAKFTNLVGDTYSVRSPYEPTAEFSRTYLLNETSKIEISTLYEGSNCAATTISRSVYAKAPYVSESEEVVEKFINKNHLLNLPKTYEVQLKVRKLIEKLKQELESSQFSSATIAYQSFADAAIIGRKEGMASDMWQNPLYNIQSRMREIIDSEYKALNDSSKFNEYYIYKNLFFNLRLASDDGCFAYYAERRDSKAIMKLYSSGPPGPDYYWAYYFAQPFSNTLRCKVSVFLYDSEFSVGKLTLIPMKKLVAISKTITCVKGKSIKKVTSSNPRCPVGYTLKK